MFPQQPKAIARPHIVPPKQDIPADAKVSFAVRYPGGRKPFETQADAIDFAKTQRSLEKGWAEVVKLIEIVVSPR